MVLHALWYISVGLPGVALLRLAVTGLWRRPPFGSFAALLAVGLARDVTLLVPSYTSHTYSILWEATLAPLLVAQAVAAVALYAAIADLYPRIGRFAVWLFGVALVLTCLGCAALLPAELGHMTAREAALRTAILLQRWSGTLITGGLVLAVGFLAHFPPPAKRLPRNLVRHAWLLASYCSAASALMLLDNLLPLKSNWHVVAQDVYFAIVIGLYGAWACCLSRAGQAIEPWTEIAPEVGALLHRREEATRRLAGTMAGLALRHAAGRK